MKNALWKDIFRDIKKSKGRFFSILSIIALGVMLFTGVKVAPIVMKTTADKYYDDYNLFDLRVISTLGLTKDDIVDIEKISGIEGVYPSKSLDALSKVGTDEFVIRVHSMPDENTVEENSNYINRLKVVEGRLPEKKGECVVAKEKLTTLNLKVGDKVSLKSGNDKDIKESLEFEEYEIVGIVETPYYLSNEIGSSNIGSGSVSTFMFIQDNNFKGDIFTDVYLTVKDSKNINSYKTEYFDVVDKITAEIEGISSVITDRRYDEVISIAKTEFEKGKNEFNNKKEEIQEKLNEAEVEINNSKTALTNGLQELEDKEIELNNSIANGELQLAQGEEELRKRTEEYEKGLSIFNEAKAMAEDSFAKAEAKISEEESKLAPMVDRKAEIEALLSNENISEEEKQKLTLELETISPVIKVITEQLDIAKSDLQNKKSELYAQEQGLNSAKSQIDSANTTIENSKYALQIAKTDGKAQIDSARNKLEEAKVTLTEGEEEFRKSKLLADEELLKAEEKLKDAENEINKMNEPKLIILDRKSHYSYVDYENSANSIDKLSNVFPVFFFVVAALVCLTTMTRMVDEQRVNIGTLKALGYSKGNIAKKFIVYALLASAIGSIIGLLLGFTILPTVIFDAYNIMYILPDIEYVVSIPIAMIVTVASIGLTTLAAYTACRIELRETPSVLMRPKAPKEGKRILLERIPFIWNRFNFTWKVTVRNIFRYKKRFLMTIIGIAGSTALLLSGFGIKDSIQTVVAKQFGVINNYDISVNIDKNISNIEKEELENKIKDKENIKEYLFVKSENVKISVNDKEKELKLIVPSKTDSFNNFITLQKRVKEEKINLPTDGIALSEKIAKMLGVKVGDEITITNSQDVTSKITVSAIVENYVGHYGYLDPSYYEKVFDRVPISSEILISLNNSNDEEAKIVSNELIGENGVSGIVSSVGIKENFSNTVESLDLVVLVMVICAGALSFIVLYNLTNVNISERIREIATIKVLGFYDKEVSSYIFRENILLSVIGTSVGLLLGIVFHRYIMVTVELENIMFGRNINSISFIIATVLTIVFSLLVNWAMYYKLKKVEMVESLKSVD